MVFDSLQYKYCDGPINGETSKSALGMNLGSECKK